MTEKYQTPCEITIHGYIHYLTNLRTISHLLRSEKPSIPKVTVSLSVSGMTCTNCSAAVRKIVMAMDGVLEATVSAVTHKAEIIVVEGSSAQPTIIAELITKGGYPSKVLSATGGTVAQAPGGGGDLESQTGAAASDKYSSCVVIIQAGGGGISPDEVDVGVEMTTTSTSTSPTIAEIKQLSGVVDASIPKSFDTNVKPSAKPSNTTTSTITILYDPNLTGPRTLLQSLNDSHPNNPASLAPDVRTQQNEAISKQMKLQLLKHRNDFLYSLFGTLPVFTISMILSKISSITFLHHNLGNNFTVEALILWVLTTPVQFVSGYQFYVGSYHG